MVSMFPVCHFIKIWIIWISKKNLERHVNGHFHMWLDIYKQIPWVALCFTKNLAKKITGRSAHGQLT